MHQSSSKDILQNGCDVYDRELFMSSIDMHEVQVIKAVILYFSGKTEAKTLHSTLPPYLSFTHTHIHNRAHAHTQIQINIQVRTYTHMHVYTHESLGTHAHKVTNACKNND